MPVDVDFHLRLLRGGSGASIWFDELRRSLIDLGFVERVRGSHHIFVKSGIETMINIQPEGRHAKPYQVRQVRSAILRHGLGGSDA